MKKRFWALFLAVMMVVSVLPTSAFAAESDSFVTVNKEAERTGEDTWKITLTIETGEIAIKPEPMDLVILMDTSYSMKWNISGSTPSNGEKCRMEIAGPAAQKLVEDLAEADINARVSVVTFASGASTKKALTQLTSGNLNGITSAIPTTSAEASTSFGTNMTAGLKEASGILQESDATNKVIVMLGDGDPYNDDDDKKNSGSYPGFGGGYGNGYGDGPNEDTLKEYLVEKGITVHTIGFSLDSDVLENIAETTGGNYYTTSSADGLTDIFTDIKNELVAMVSDDMRDKSSETYVSIQNILDYPVDSSISVSTDGKYMSWNPADGVLGEKQEAIITYTVKLDDVDDFEPGEHTIKLNGDAVLSYQAGDETGTLKFPVPEADIEVAQLVTEIYLDDEPYSTKPIEKIIVFGNKTFTWDKPDDTIVVGNETYEYLESTYNGEKTNELSAEVTAGGTYTVAHYYVSEPKTFDVTYSVSGDIPEGYTAPADAEHKVGAPVHVADVPTETGYTFDGWYYDANGDGDGEPEKVTEFTMPAHDVELTGSWSINKYEYTVNYYKDQIDQANLLNTDTGTEDFGEAIPYTDGKYLPTGYTTPGVVSGQETITAVSENNVLNVVYGKDTYGYTIKYYYDGVFDNTKTDTLTAQFGDEISAYTDKAGDDYCLDYDTAPITISANVNANVIEVYYAKDVWNDVTNEDDVSDDIPDKYQVRIKYVSNDTEKGTVSPSMDIVTLLDKTGGYASAGEVITSEATATATAGNGFKNWTDYTGTEMTEEGKTLSEQAFEAEGGETYTYTAYFSAATTPVVVKIPYYIEHYQEQPNGDYVKVETDTEFAVSGTKLTAIDVDAYYNSYTNYTANKMHEDRVDSGTVAYSVDTTGATPVATLLTLKLYYDLDEYEVTYSWTGLPETADVNVPETEIYVYGAIVEADTRAAGDQVAVGEDTYVFSGWSTQDVTVTNGEFDMPANNVAFSGTWELDNWNDEGDEPTGGDKIPDKYQALVQFSAEENGTVTGAGITQVFTFGENATSGSITPSLEQVTVTPAEDYAFDIWTMNDGETGVNPAATITVQGGSTTNFYAHFAVDVIGGKEGGDDIPDKYQAVVTYKVDNGTWSDNSSEEIIEVFTLKEKDPDGVWKDIEGVVLGKTIPSGMKANANYDNGSWNVEIAADTAVTGNATYTYAFQPYGLNVNKVLSKVNGEAYVTGAKVYAGDILLWEITLQNTGDIDMTVTVADVFKGEARTLYTDEACTATATSEITVAEDETVSLYATYTVQETDRSLSNKVTVTRGEDTWEKETPEITVVKPSVSITKVADKTSVRVGDKVTYTITVKNTGNSDLTNVKITDDFLDGGKGKKTTEGTWSIDTLKPGESIVAKLVYTTVSDDLSGLMNSAVVDTNETTENETTEEVEVKRDSITPVGPSKPALNYEDHINYIIGYEDGFVRPLNTITRAEVATIFFRLLDDESRENFWSKENPFPDVTIDMWCNNAISTMFNAGIITGYPDGTFGPYDPVSRAEFATIAARFSEVKDTDGETNFLDLSKSYWAYSYIELAEELGWVQGYQGYFRPEDDMTRAEVMTTVNRVLKRAVEEDGMLKGMIEWPDNLPSDWFYEDVQEATNSHTYYRTNKRVKDVGPYQPDYYYEKWSELIENPDWAALERAWSDANDK